MLVCRSNIIIQKDKTRSTYILSSGFCAGRLCWAGRTQTRILCDKASYMLEHSIIAGRGGLVVNTSDSGSRGRGFEPQSGRRVVSLSKTYLPPKALVISRKRWLRPNMSEKLFTGTLSIKPNKILSIIESV